MLLIFGLLSAFIPNFAYVRITSDFQGMLAPHIDYPSLEFSNHAYTPRFGVVAFAGLLGLFSFLNLKGKRLELAISSLVFANLSFWLPPLLDVISIPEFVFTDLPWVGCILVLVGILLVFVGISHGGTKVPRVAFLSVPLLFGAYLVYPFIIVSGDLTLLANLSLHRPLQYLVIHWLIMGLSFAGQLLMVWGAYKAILSTSKKKVKNNKNNDMKN